MNDPLTQKIIGCCYRIHQTMGFGFLESVYEKALSWELASCSIPHELQKRIQVFYSGQIVGDFVCDLLVDNRLLVELKAISTLSKIHEVQLVNYLVATRIDVGLLINFGAEKVQVKRKYRTTK